MAFVLTKAQIYGIEAEEAVNKRYQQKAILTVTAANTDVDLDLGDLSPGTFWNAVDATSVGAAALSAFKDISSRAESFTGVGGSSIAGYAQGDASIPQVTALTSAASAGGSATETLTVTGLLTTDTILGATIVEDGATPAYIQEAAKTCAVNGQYIVTFSADPGAGAEVRVIISRAVTAVQAGTYQLSMDATYTQMPNILFLSTDAPTSYVIELSWSLKAGEQPVEYYGEA
jgi:hypothetical protein